MSNINDRFIKSLKLPSNKHKIHWDEKITGFGIRITNNNAKSFVLRYNINGKERKYTIGKYPELSSTAAREMAIKLKGKIINGFDPLSDKQQSYSLPTIKELGLEYIKSKEKMLRKSTLEGYELILKVYILPKFENHRINSISKRDVENFHSSLSDKPYMANRTLQLLSSMFSSAVKWGWIEKDPIKDIKKFSEEKRNGFLSDQQIENLMNVLDSQPNKINANIIKLILFTGSRKSEVLSARWQDFDFNNEIWMKPASLTKQNKPSPIPLNQEALTILKELKNNIKLEDEAKKDELIISNSQYLFYNLKTKSPIKDIKSFWKKICEMANLQNIRIHDLRHTFASILVNSGVSLEIAGKLMGHCDTRTTARYSHLINDTLRNATEIFGGKIAKMNQ